MKYNLKLFKFIKHFIVNKAVQIKVLPLSGSSESDEESSEEYGEDCIYIIGCTSTAAVSFKPLLTLVMRQKIEHTKAGYIQ